MVDVAGAFAMPLEAEQDYYKPSSNVCNTCSFQNYTQDQYNDSSCMARLYL